MSYAPLPAGWGHSCPKSTSTPSCLRSTTALTSPFLDTQPTWRLPWLPPSTVDVLWDSFRQWLQPLGGFATWGQCWVSRAASSPGLGSSAVPLPTQPGLCSQHQLLKSQVPEGQLQSGSEQLQSQRPYPHAFSRWSLCLLTGDWILKRFKKPQFLTLTDILIVLVLYLFWIKTEKW